MVTRLMWWPWPTGSSKKFAVRLVVRGIEGFPVDNEAGAETRMKAVVRWKGKTRALRSLKRNCTREEVVSGDRGKVEWNEEFESVAVLTAQRENGFNPWEIEIAVFSGLKPGAKNKTSVVGMTSLNLAEYASAPGEEFELNLPLLLCGSAQSCPILNLSLKLYELRTCPQQQETVQKPTTSPSSFGDKDELSFLKAGFRRVFIEFLPGRKFRKTLRGDESSDGKSSIRTEDSYYAHTDDTDSMEDDEPNEELECCKDAAIIQKSFCYDTLAAANMLGVTIYNDITMNDNHEDLIYYSHKRYDVGSSHFEEAMPSSTEKSPRRSILPWKKRKYRFRSPKAKGEPLLKKAYAEEGGDDIDYDRRLLSSSDESLSGKKSDDDGSAHHSLMSEFGDDNFAVGSWESKEIISRCGQMKLSTQVFFASIDQRNERAAGQSACTALVAVIADWFQSNKGMMPIKSQLDSLIREGSLEWRNMCKNQTYRERFPDEHFDLETVLEAKIRLLSVVSGKSFIGFFHPEGCEDNRGFEFLHGAMSFDSIWEEISKAEPDCVFIVSWNDHFFVLKVEQDAYYIIDTLGERLYEGCDQAYILKFDKSTAIHKLLIKKENSADGKEKGSCRRENECDTPEEVEEQLVCNGKESCKEYIKSFLAAIPIRELQADTKKGLMASTPLHQRLQIEFHYTEASTSLISSPVNLSPATGQILTV